LIRNKKALYFLFLGFKVNEVDIVMKC